MKYVLILSLFLLFDGISAKAQFNTIGGIVRRYDYSPKYSLDNNERLDSDDVPDTLSSADVRTLADSLKSACVFSLPIEGPLHITSLFGMRKHPTLHQWRFHNGIDIRARYVPVLTMMPGVVHRTGCDKASGKFITLRHGNIFVSYCHLSEIWVMEGQRVCGGQRIGRSGNTGERSTGPHLHLTCRIGEKRIDMARLLVYIIKCSNL